MSESIEAKPRRHRLVKTTDNTGRKICWVCGKLYEKGQKNVCTPSEHGLFTNMWQNGKEVFNLWTWVKKRRHGKRKNA